jgi:phosphoribosyl-ATP pyrophosphohydrolase/phosphoribosyl-AMP cyclohydrolase
VSELRTVTSANELVYSLPGPEGQGTIPVICIDSAALASEGLRAYRMQAYATKEAAEITLATNRATFWSRSKKRLWTKGEESGNFLIVRSAYTDCDSDSLLLDVSPMGPTCHTGANSCFET